MVWMVQMTGIDAIGVQIQIESENHSAQHSPLYFLAESVGAAADATGEYLGLQRTENIRAK